MGAFEVGTETAFRKESFTAKLVESGIKLFGDGNKAVMKAFLRFDDELPPMTFNITNNKTGKSIFDTKPDGSIKTKNYGIGQIIEFMLEKKGIKSCINLDPGEEAWWFGSINKPENNVAVGLNWTFEAHPSQKKLENGQMVEGYTNFLLTDVAADSASPPDNGNAKAVAPAPHALNLDVWKTLLDHILTIPLDEKGINKEVVAYAKKLEKTPEALGLIDRRKNLKALCDSGYLEINEEGDYIKKVSP